MGAPVFRYHAPSTDDFPRRGVSVYAVTDDPDEAARAPFGRISVGDPSDALVRITGLRLGNPDRPVVALIGDGAMRYTRAALWTAARYQVAVTFVVCTTTYRALQEFSEVLHVPEGDYLDICGLNVLDIARGYGVETHRAGSLDDLTDYIRKGTSATGPRLVEILQR
ncbi:thiamine pyrophosphate-dependent enzyme [Streptomyces sp. NPDC059224]|uniref:thiamine pyrophosphate-dependent enzyme n=1 Tax=Streptomyces sp. NPDC059224 TaxID=3346775 RepID=UPI0036768940